MAENYSGTAYSTDVADIGEGATYSTASGEMTTADRYEISMLAYATGANASSSGAVTFNLVPKIAGKWCTDNSWEHITLVVSGTSEDVSKPIILNVGGIQAIRVQTIVNGDPTYHITNVNVAFSVPPRR